MVRFLVSSRRPHRAYAAAFVLALLAVAPQPARAAFPGADGSIAFGSNRDTGAGDLYSIGPGGAATRLTTSTSSSDPAYSPDGRRIAYVDANYQIAVMNRDGSGPTPITSGGTAKRQPAWSPDGRIAFVANSFDVDGQTDLEIWVVDADGSGLVQLTNNDDPDMAPAWSPDGGRIAFVGTREGDVDRNVYLMNADGAGEVNLTPGESQPCEGLCYQGHDDSPAWFPDGSRIAYVHTWAENASGVPNIWAMSPDGSGKTNLTDNAEVAFTQPAPSPQGTRIAAIGAVTTDRDLWVMNADGSAQAAIEGAPSKEADPDWGVAPPPPPSDIAFGKVVRNKRTGTARLTVRVPAPGSLVLTGRNLRRRSASVQAAGPVRVGVLPKGKLRRTLRRTGKATARVRVAFTPEGGTRNAERTKVRLVRRTR